MVVADGLPREVHDDVFDGVEDPEPVLGDDLDVGTDDTKEEIGRPEEVVCAEDPPFPDPRPRFTRRVSLRDRS